MPSDAKAAAEGVRPESSKFRQKILIVDDDEDVLRSTEMMLNLLGFDAVPLMNAGRTVALAERERPALILQDLRMRGLDLPRLVSSLKSNPTTGRIPLVLFSAAEDVAEMAAQVNADGYLSKPFDEEQLTQLLVHVLDRPGEATPANPDPTLRQNVMALFHDFQNALAAVNTYSKVAEESSQPQDQREAVRHIRRLILQLEERTRQLRRGILCVLER